jgi:hypothetical protein
MLDSSTIISPETNTVHFLHIGKCAGTNIKGFIKAINREMGQQLITAHYHNVGLKDLPANAQYFFSVRDPVARFYSGFYSRKRKGQPRHFIEWTKAEELAFNRFPEANDVAENIFSDAVIGRHAFSAMMAIRHVNRSQHTWFDDLDRVFDTHPPLCILRTEHLDRDILFLKKLLNFQGNLILQTDDVSTHRNNYSKTTPLSLLAINNLKAWYAADMYFNKLTMAWIEAFQT